MRDEEVTTCYEMMDSLQPPEFILSDSLQERREESVEKGMIFLHESHVGVTPVVTALSFFAFASFSQLCAQFPSCSRCRPERGGDAVRTGDALSGIFPRTRVRTREREHVIHLVRPSQTYSSREDRLPAYA